MKKLTAGIFATILGLTAMGAADAAVPSQHYVDTAITAAEGRAATDAATKAGQALADAKAWVEQQAYATEAYADGEASTALGQAKAYTDEKVGPLPQGTADVVTYVNTKTEGIASNDELQALQQTVNGHTTSITNLTNDKLDKSTYTTDKATFETVTGAAGKYEPILDATERAAITSGIDATKVGQIATAIETANDAKEVAENAAGVANTAEVTAGEAKTIAEGAVTTANEAKTAAQNAQTTANTAKDTADAAAKDATDAVTEAQAATAAVGTLTTTVNGHTTSIGNLQSGKLNVVPATSVTTDGQYVLTMKKEGETMTYGWELITRSEGQ